jgi:3-phosphoshikimate 1-carboxyvinyltransferase
MSSLTGSSLVPRVSRVGGRLRVPGDKSISHRYAMLAAIAEGTSRLRGYAPGADCAATLACLEALGVRVTRSSGGDGRAPHGDTMTIDGLGPRGLRAPAHPLDAANSGTSMRLLAGLLAAHPFRAVIGGDASLSRRPMRRVIDPLTRMGASIASIDGRPPLTIDGGSLKGISFEPEVPSAQVKSAVLLAGLHAAGRTTVVEPAPTRDHTERALEAFGGRVAGDGLVISVEGGQRLRAVDADIPGDLSSAMFWLALAAGTPGSRLVIEGVGLNPSRTAALDVLKRAGGEIEVLDLSPEGGSRGDARGRHGEPVGALRVRFGEVRPFDVAPEEVPGVIDELPALAALAAMTPHGRMSVRGASELRVKESDRIAMLAKGFGGIGIRVEEYADGFTVHGGPPSGGNADAAGDHRLAMAFAIAGSRASGPVHISGAEAVAVSYPGFFEQLETLARAR